MKNLIACTCVALAMVAGADMKFGVVNLEVLIKNHPSHASNRTLVKSTADDYRNKMEAYAWKRKLAGTNRALAGAARNIKTAAGKTPEYENRIRFSRSV